MNAGKSLSWQAAAVTAAGVSTGVANGRGNDLASHARSTRRWYAARVTPFLSRVRRLGAEPSPYRDLDRRPS